MPTLSFFGIKAMEMTMMMNRISTNMATLLCFLVALRARPVAAWTPQTNTGGGLSYANLAPTPIYNNYDVYPNAVDGGAWAVNNAYENTNGQYNSNNNFNHNMGVLQKKYAQPSQTRYFADRIQEARQRALNSSMETNKHKAAVNVLGRQQPQQQQQHHEPQSHYVNNNYQHQGYCSDWAPRRSHQPQVVDISATHITDDYVVYDVPSPPTRRLRPYNPRPIQRYSNQQSGYAPPPHQPQQENRQSQIVPSYHHQGPNNMMNNDQALLQRLSSLTETEKRRVLRQLMGLSMQSGSSALTMHAEPFNPALVKVDMSPQAVAYRQDVGRQRIAQARHDAMQRTQDKQTVYNYNGQPMNNQNNFQQPPSPPQQPQDGNHYGNMPLPGWNNNNSNNNNWNNDRNIANNNNNNWRGGRNFGNNVVPPPAGNAFSVDQGMYENNSNNSESWGVWA